MALLFADGFDHYATTDLTQMWTSIRSFNGSHTVDPVIQGASSRFAAGGVRLQTNGTGAQARALIITPQASPSGATGVVGFAFRFNDAISSLHLNTSSYENAMLCSIFRSGGVRQLAVVLNTDGTISIVRTAQAQGGFLSSEATLATSTRALTEDVWYYIEFKWVLNNATGSIEVRVDNETWALATNADTIPTSGTADWNSLEIGPVTTTGVSTVISWDYDDLYLLDGTGTTANDFLGDIRIDPHYPTANGATVEGTRGGADSGANWSQVEETAPNEDTDYVTHSTIGHKDLYEVTNLVNTGAAIKAVLLCVNGKKAAAGASAVAGVVRHSSTNYVASGQASNETHRYHLYPYAVNPGTSAAWTETDFNNAQFGVQKTA